MTKKGCVPNVTEQLTIDGPRWGVRCNCGFLVYNLDTWEAAADVYHWHRGEPSVIGSYAKAEHSDGTERG